MERYGLPDTDPTMREFSNFYNFIFNEECDSLFNFEEYGYGNLFTHQAQSNSVQTIHGDAENVPSTVHLQMGDHGVNSNISEMSVPPGFSDPEVDEILTEMGVLRTTGAPVGMEMEQVEHAENVAIQADDATDLMQQFERFEALGSAQQQALTAASINAEDLAPIASASNSDKSPTPELLERIRSKSKTDTRRTTKLISMPGPVRSGRTKAGCEPVVGDTVSSVRKKSTPRTGGFQHIHREVDSQNQSEKEANSDSQTPTTSVTDAAGGSAGGMSIRGSGGIQHALQADSSPRPLFSPEKKIFRNKRRKMAGVRGQELSAQASEQEISQRKKFKAMDTGVVSIKTEETRVKNPAPQNSVQNTSNVCFLVPMLAASSGSTGRVLPSSPAVTYSTPSLVTRLPKESPSPKVTAMALLKESPSPKVTAVALLKESPSPKVTAVAPGLNVPGRSVLKVPQSSPETMSLQQRTTGAGATAQPIVISAHRSASNSVATPKFRVIAVRGGESADSKTVNPALQNSVEAAGVTCSASLRPSSAVSQINEKLDVEKMESQFVSSVPVESQGPGAPEPSEGVSALEESPADKKYTTITTGDISHLASHELGSLLHHDYCKACPHVEKPKDQSGQDKNQEDEEKPCKKCPRRVVIESTELEEEPSDVPTPEQLIEKASPKQKPEHKPTGAPASQHKPCAASPRPQRILVDTKTNSVTPEVDQSSHFSQSRSKIEKIRQQLAETPKQNSEAEKYLLSINEFMYHANCSLAGRSSPAFELTPAGQNSASVEPLSKGIGVAVAEEHRCQGLRSQTKTQLSPRSTHVGSVETSKVESSPCEGRDERRNGQESVREEEDRMDSLSPGHKIYESLGRDNDFEDIFRNWNKIDPKDILGLSHNVPLIQGTENAPRLSVEDSLHKMSYHRRSGSSSFDVELVKKQSNQCGAFQNGQMEGYSKLPGYLGQSSLSIPTPSGRKELRAEDVGSMKTNDCIFPDQPDVDTGAMQGFSKLPPYATNPANSLQFDVEDGYLAEYPHRWHADPATISQSADMPGRNSRRVRYGSSSGCGSDSQGSPISLSDRSRSRSRSRSPEYVRSSSRRRSQLSYNKNAGSWKDRRLKDSQKERKVVYVGGIAKSCEESDLRRAFKKFGRIQHATVRFREKQDNYGFVYFYQKEDAHRAIELGSKDPSLKHYKLSYGGRREFCHDEYADLDGKRALEEEFRLPERSQHEEQTFEELLRQFQRDKNH